MGLAQALYVSKSDELPRAGSRANDVDTPVFVPRWVDSQGQSLSRSKYFTHTLSISTRCLKISLENNKFNVSWFQNRCDELTSQEYDSTLTSINEAESFEANLSSLFLAHRYVIFLCSWDVEI